MKNKLDDEIRILFDEYNRSFEKLKVLKGDLLPRSLNLFNIRIRLALDIIIDFNGEISLTKSKEVRDTYVLIIRLMESWNAYEALFHFAKDIKKCANPNGGIYKAYSQIFLMEIGTLAILRNSLDELKLKYLAEKNFRYDFVQLIDRIQLNPGIRSKLSGDCKAIIEYFKGEKNISGIEMIALIYAERNMYYHNGETAKMGMNYGNRQFLIRSLTTSFYKHMLLLAKSIIDKEYDDSV
jgi:hypothetical protein